MAKKIRKQNKEGLAVSLGKIVEGVARGIGGLLGFAANLEAQGKDEYVEQGKITGKTKSGKEYRGSYGFRMKVGLPICSQEAKAALNPRELRATKRLPGEWTAPQ